MNKTTQPRMLRGVRRAALAGLLMLGAATLAVPAAAQERPYTEGSVWSVTLIKVKPGMGDAYLNEVLPMRKALMDEAKRQGLVLSHKVLSGSAANRDDWDLMLLVEFKNWAAFDNTSQKWEAIQAKLVGTPDKQTQLMIKRADTREIVGEKLMQELLIK